MGNRALPVAKAEALAPIPLMRPRLPEADAILPYLRQIDSARQYTNSGPLLEEFETRLAAHFGIRRQQVACVVNATLGLTLSLLALAPRGQGRCIVPAWTFEATATAVTAAGLKPWFFDVDADSWALSPSGILDAAAFRDAVPPVAVIPVSPFGARIDRAAWDQFAAKTGIPVVIDAAAGFDSLVPGPTPSVISLHATKLLSTGEGGAIVSTDEAFIARVRRLANYGFEPVRRIAQSGLNAKMSEYAAAVGLADLDGWPAKRRLIAGLALAYRELLGNCDGLAMAPGFSAETVQSTCNVKLGARRADALVEWLTKRGIGARKWWGNGCHRQPAFAHRPRAALPMTEELADTVVGLPFFADLAHQDMASVAAAVREFLRQGE